MYFIPITIIVLSISGILYIVIKKVRAIAVSGGGRLVYPEFSPGQEKDSVGEESGFGYNILRKALSVREGDALFVVMEKFFRRMRVRLMKIENFLTNLVDRLHEKSLEKKSGSSRDDSDNSNTLIIQELGGNACIKSPCFRFCYIYVPRHK